ncbi:MAG: P-loop NTPase [Candidatus Thorarchaeota archaeon]|nr:P-loop NTPase [Candidatus Thorarchaeota archaeon]
MILTIASGKGGTGKTSVAVNLALSLGNVRLLDCDVEEPNAHLLLGQPPTKTQSVTTPVPQIDPSKCTLCGDCARFCRYHALFVAPKEVLFYKDLCHSCGACSVVCPTGAITEVGREIGTLHTATVGDLFLAYGLLDIGEPVVSRLISAVKRHIVRDALNILDAPPGTACPVIETMRESDFILLVAEPTPFGLHDLSLALDVVEQLGIPRGVVLNRAGLGDDSVHELCISRDVPVLLEIPFDRRIAELYSRGVPFVTVMPEWAPRFRRMFEHVQEMTKGVQPSGSSQR